MSDPNPTPAREQPVAGTPTSVDTAPLWFGEAPPTTELPAPPPPPAPAISPIQEQPRSTGNGRRIAELTVVASLAALLASGGTLAATRLDSQDSPTPSAATSSSPGRGTVATTVVQADAQNPNWTATAAVVSPSVVAISVQTTSGASAGSGVLLDSAGHVLTNNHVVDGANQVSVSLSDGRTFKGTIKGADPSTDLAVVAITNPPADLKPIAIGDSEALKVGDPVMAVGNPLRLAGTVTTGIVSALNRPVRTSASDSSNPFGQGRSAQQDVVTNAIQISAAINPGNSGGALVNGRGQLVGINTAIASLSSGSGQAGSIGIGFAIPIREAQAIADQLIAKGQAEHAFLGVSTEDGTASDGTADRSGAQITSVSPGTPAAEAGIKTGDVVVAVDGEMVDSADSLIANIRERTVGESVELTVLRNGEQRTLTAKLVTKPATAS